MLFLTLFSIVFGICFYFYILKANKYWEEKGVLQVKSWPILGSMLPFILQRKTAAYVMEDMYKEFSNARYFGMYQFLKPTLVLRYPELIKTITTKEFDSFPNRDIFVPEDVDPLWGKSLLGIRGIEKWKHTRSALTPTFTSSKMKMMFNLMNDCAKKVVEHFSKEEGTITVEMKDIYSRYTNDVIASTAFGVTCDSLKDQKNEFYLLGLEITDFSGFKLFSFCLFALSTTLAKLLNVKIFSTKSATYFTNVIKESIAIRKKQNITRPDMLQLLIEAQKDSRVSENLHGEAIESKSQGQQNIENLQIRELTDVDIAAQAIIFYFAGFDTTSTMMSHASYELALNPDIQEKLLQEVDSIYNKCGGELTYEAVTQLKYMDMVLAEALRKWPPFPSTDRHSVKPFIIETTSPDESPVHIDLNTTVLIPIFSIHRDPKYFPNPEKFDPERFSDANKDAIMPYTYIPFGAGPRNCIASRFALLEGKVVLFHLLSRYKIIPVARSKIPLEICKKQFSLISADGWWVGFEPRNKIM